jgi:hypothetical protein
VVRAGDPRGDAGDDPGNNRPARRPLTGWQTAANAATG